MASPTVAPVFLRIALAATFLWAGIGKFVMQSPVQGEDAARLANMGVPIAPAGSPGKPAPADVTKPETKPESKPDGKSDGKPAPTEPLPAPSSTGKEPGKGKSPPLMVAEPAKSPAESTAHTYSASDFPQPAQVTGLYQIALAIDHSAHPRAGADGKVPMAIWPAPLAKDRLPVYFAWLAALTEALGGLFCLVGLLTRFSGLMLSGVMAVAMWLTQFGPTLQSGGGYLWIIPKYDLWGVNAGGMPFYATLMWQLSLLMCGLALMCIGPGGLSLDRALFPPKGAAKPAPKAE